MTIDSLSAIEDLGEGHTWFKLIFDIVDIERTKIGVSSVRAVAFRALGNTPVGEIGFEVRVPLEGWNKQILQETLSVDYGRIVLRSVGQPTDRLLQLLEEQFGLPVSGNPASPEISCTAVLLGDDPAKMEYEAIHTKLFFDALAKHNPSSYAELYLNFDLKARCAYLMEKDSEYRVPIVAWLAGRYRQAGQSLH